MDRLELIKSNAKLNILSGSVWIKAEDRKWLIDTVEQLRNREARHIELKLQYVNRINEAEEENKKLHRTICDLRKKTSFRVYEENLRLVQEIERLKQGATV